MLFGKNNSLIGKLGVILLAGGFGFAIASYYSKGISDYDEVKFKPNPENSYTLPRTYFEPEVDPILSLGVNKFKILSVGERKARLEDFLEKDFDESSRRGKINFEYLVENLRFRPDVDRYLANPVQLRKDLTMNLLLKKHSYRPGQESFYDESLNDIDAFSFGQSLRAYLLVDALKDQECVDQVGLMIQDDLADSYSEHGGVVKFNSDLKLFLQTIPGFNFGKDSVNNNTYIVPPEFKYLEFGQLAQFHFHATQDDDAEYSGPSAGEFSDVKTIIHQASTIGEAHGFVITKLAGNKFNIDYYGCVRAVNNNLDVHVLDLGVYTYRISKSEK